MNIVRRFGNGKLIEFLINGIPQPIPTVAGQKLSVRHRTTWPIALLPLKLLAKEGDRGAGDIIARTIGPFGGDAFKVWYKRIFGKICGCDARQDDWNARWPL